jgi:4-amino-4-deoxy-L-arabinose transferase-like glycosyltransferase
MSRRTSSWTTALCLTLILGASLVPRLPVLYNAADSFNSDEAVNALVIKHLLEHGELTLHNWDATYYGIVEGLLAVPFVWIDGYTPLAFKLSAVAGFLFLLLATYLLGARLFGRAAGLTATALLAAFSPQLVLWSTLASGGYTLVIAWGTFTFAAFHALLAGPRPPAAWKLALFGWILGFGLYIYELYLVYVAVFAVYAVTSSALWQKRNRDFRRDLRAAALLAAGLAAGWAPKVALLLGGTTGSKKPSYAFAAWERIGRNLELLTAHCAPALFGANPAGTRELAYWVGEPWPLSRLLGVLLLAFYAAAWLWALRRSWPRLLGALRRTGTLDTECLMVLLVPLTALLFVLSPNPQDVLSDRYLLPWLSSVPLFGGALLARLGRRSEPANLIPRAAAAAALVFVLVAYPLIDIARIHQNRGYLGADLHLTSRREPIEDVLGYLKREGVRGGYGPYWFSYEATFLSREAIVVTPLLDWDRHPEYTHQVQGMRNVAYVFDAPAQAAHQVFLELLRKTGNPYRIQRIGPFSVYTSPRRERLLPAYAFSPPQPIARPAARIEILAAPATAAPGAILQVPVRVTNTGGDVWSADGLASGTYRVAVAYRWLDAKGAAVIAEGERTLLPEDVPPGGSTELKARVPVPAQPGSYRLLVTLVQESVAWFDQAAGAAAVCPVEVRPR